MHDNQLHSRIAGGTPGHSCQTCEHWNGIPEPSGAAVCWRERPRPTVNPQPARGCVFWLRAIGSDDEDPGRRKPPINIDEIFPDDDGP